MASLLTRIRSNRVASRKGELRAVEVFSTWEEAKEDPLTDFESYVTGAYQSNGPVFALILARMLMLSEARFKYRTTDDDKTLFGNPTLARLETPWPGGTTGELIAKMLLHVDLAGTAYVSAQDPDKLQMLRPDRVRIIGREGGDIAGYGYWRDGVGRGTPQFLAASEVARWAPVPDGLANWRGMSWITPIARELIADKKMTTHRDRFFTNAAVPGMVIKVEKKLEPEDRQHFEEIIARRYSGEGNAYKTMLVEGGADVEVVGSDMNQASFATVMAAGENRLASAAAVPPIVVGFKEGLQAATYSNYAQALRRFADLTIRPLWRSMAASLAPLMPVPDNAELWYDDSDIPALQQDAKDSADIMLTKANAAGVLLRAGYVPDLVAGAVGLPDIEHTGAIPVTLYQDGAPTPTKSGDDSND